MDNSLSKVNQISHLATKSVDDKKINLLQKHNNNDLGIVADQFESIFVYQMLKQARQSKLAEGIFSSEAQDTFNNMLDMEYSEILSKKNNFGIAEALIKQFQSHVNPKKDKQWPPYLKLEKQVFKHIGRLYQLQVRILLI